MNDTLLKSYNRSFNGGKSRFARICDNVFSALLLTAALYLLVSRKLHHGAASLFAAMLISASILLTASLLRSLRFNAHIKKLRRETSESILRRRILVSPEVDEVIRSLHRSSSEYPNQACSEQSATRSFYLLRTEKAITFDDILPIIREALEKGISHIVIYSVSKPEPEAESAVRTVGTAAVEFRLLETIPQIRERLKSIPKSKLHFLPPSVYPSGSAPSAPHRNSARKNTLQSTSLRAWDYMLFRFFRRTGSICGLQPRQ